MAEICEYFDKLAISSENADAMDAMVVSRYGEGANRAIVYWDPELRVRFFELCHFVEDNRVGITMNLTQKFGIADPWGARVEPCGPLDEANFDISNDD